MKKENIQTRNRKQSVRRSKEVKDSVNLQFASFLFNQKPIESQYAASQPTTGQNSTSPLSTTSSSASTFMSSNQFEFGFNFNQSAHNQTPSSYQYPAYSNQDGQSYQSGQEFCAPFHNLPVFNGHSYMPHSSVDARSVAAVAAAAAAAATAASLRDTQPFNQSPTQSSSSTSSNNMSPLSSSFSPNYLHSKKQSINGQHQHHHPAFFNLAQTGQSHSSNNATSSNNTEVNTNGNSSTGRDYDQVICY